MPHILLIEDNPGDARLIKELLSEADDINDSHRITHVERISQALDVLAAPNMDIDIILSDISLPDSIGLDTLQSLTAAASELPVIFMTGTNDEMLAMKAIQQGAQDYIIKGHHDGDTLARAITYATERKKFQKELGRAKAKEQSDHERIRMLAQQKRQLLALTRAKDEFVSLASHQLRTPATVVKQYLGMVLQGYVGDISAEVKEVIETAYDSNERQISVIGELLKTAQLDSKSTRLHVEPYDINELVAEVIASLKPTTDMRQQKVNFDRAKPLMVQLDHNEIFLVLENILGNASKYSSQQRPISVYVKHTSKYAQICIKDHGVGISKQDQKKVFEKFTRIDNPLSDTVSGNGLGLYWVRRIIKLHKGLINLKSELGEGSEFTISLPLQTPAD